MNIQHKMKTVMLSALVAMGGGILFTSCEDMFTTDNGLVNTNLSPNDTVYTMMGIVKNMQRIMDRTVIFGELRSDLVDVDPNHTAADLRDISSFDVTTENSYNDPRDFYNVINSCNVYLANVDAERMAIHSNNDGYGELYFEKEIIATKCYRAWTYLQLAQIYGAENIPFILEPITTSDAAEQMVADRSNRTTMVDLCTTFIDDIKPYADKIDDNEDLMPDYSVTFHSGQESNTDISYRKFFIPVRLMLAELYLWRGSKTQNKADFREAVRYYHEFLTHGRQTNSYLTSRYNSTWSTGTTEKFSFSTSTYDNNFRLANQLAFIPMDTTAYLGNTSNIREIFSSKYSNNYYPEAQPSQHLKEISQSQLYCYVDYTNATTASDVEVEYVPNPTVGTADERSAAESFLRTRFNDNWWIYAGDLRLRANYSFYDVTSTNLNANYSNKWSFVSKWEFNGNASGGSNFSSRTTTDQRPEFIPLYRISVVYLHLAEALNQAGFPESAFVILKYGLSTQALHLYAPGEFEQLKTITAISSSDINATEWNPTYFVTADMVSFTQQTNHSYNQYPIHSYGSGESILNDKYTIGIDYSDPAYALGDETILYLIDDEGNIILDDEGNPDLNADGTPVYNYGPWYLNSNTGEIGFLPGPTATTWTGYILEDVPDYLQSVRDFDDFVENFSDWSNVDITTLTDEEIEAAYDEYKTFCQNIQTVYNHNRALKANLAAQQQVNVAKLILDEEALEGMFEGTRFGDLMRYSWQTGNPAFLGQTVAKRTGQDTPDATLAGKLASEAGWYVKIPAR